MNVAFLDRDGTLLWEPPETEQIDSLAKFRVLPGVFEGLAALQRRGFALVMVSNQDGAGHARLPQRRLRGAAGGTRPPTEQARHHAVGSVHLPAPRPPIGCPCRKPRTGLVDEYLRRERGRSGRLR